MVIPSEIDGIPVGGIEKFHNRNITSVTIMSDLAVGIWSNAFSDCSNLMSITFSGSHPEYMTVDGVLYQSGLGRGLSYHVLIAYPEGRSGEFTVPDGVTAVEAYAFAGSNLTSIILPESVEFIGIGSFARCSNLKSIVIPNSSVRYLEAGPTHPFTDSPNLTIYSKAGSVMEGYAKSKGIPFSTGLPGGETNPAQAPNPMSPLEPPLNPGTFAPFSTLATGDDYSLAIKNDGSLWAWGYNENGQLGDGTTTFRQSPVKIMESVVSVSTGGQLDGYYTVAIKRDGSLWAWGSNSYGQLGDGTTTNRLLPVKITDDIAAISTYETYSMTIKNDGSLWAWGENRGQFLVELDTELSKNDYFSPIKIMDGLKLPGGGTTIPPSTSLDSAASWAREGITNAIAKGFVPTDLQSNYSNVITRQEFCRMAVKWVESKTGKTIDAVLAEKGLSRNPNAFTDTDDPDILAALALGITNGTGSNTFTPNGEFSREQAATMIMNTCKAIGMNVDNPPDSDFADIGSASSWAVNGINFVRANGIMGGTSTTVPTFNPKGTYTRQESIVTFLRSYDVVK